LAASRTSIVGRVPKLADRIPPGPRIAEWNGKLIQGRHEALIPAELWERVQGVLDGRFAKKAKRGKHDFAFSGLIACAQCSCAVVGEIKKERYVYYHWHRLRR
jgi:hypothetical protein